MGCSSVQQLPLLQRLRVQSIALIANKLGKHGTNFAHHSPLSSLYTLLCILDPGTKFGRALRRMVS